MRARAGIYLDSNAGAPLRPEVVAALRPLLKEQADFASNPSSTHTHGRRARRLIQDAREKVAVSLGPKTDPERLLFVSSGTEANQMAIRSVLEPLLLQGKKPHWITSELEHDCVLQMVSWLQDRGGSVSFLPADAEGRFQFEKLREIARPETALISLIWVHNETGLIQDLPGLRDAVAALPSHPALHLDGAQAWGKLQFDVNDTGADLVAFAGHKVGALPGTGILWHSDRVALRPIFPGNQARGLRGGTENLAGAISLGAVATAINVPAWQGRVEPSRDSLEHEIIARIPGVRIAGGGGPRVENTVQVIIDGVPSDSLVMNLDLEGISASAGAACSAGTPKPSRSLLAMGYSPEAARSALRISLCDALGEGKQEKILTVLERVISRLRSAPTPRRERK